MKRVLIIIMAMLMCISVLTACEKDEKSDSSMASSEITKTTIRIGGLKGPTSMGMVKLMEDAEKGATENNYEFTVEATADMITPKLVKGELDMVAVPANLASVLYNKNEGKFQVIALNTLGVLYVVEKNSNISTLTDLKGKTVYATGKGSTPEYNLRYLLTQAGVDPDKDLTIEWKNEPNEVVALLKTADSGVAMLPQPYVTVAKSQVEGLNTAVNLNEEWNKLNNGSMMVTGVMIVRKEFAEANKGAIDAFLKEYKASTEYINANAEEASAWVEKRIGVKAAVAKQAIPYCNITFISGTEMKNALSGYLNVLFEQKAESVGGKMPGDDFYYGA